MSALPSAGDVREIEARTDHTDRLHAWADGRLGEGDLEALDGYVFKARSPSCGVEGVDVFDGDEAVDRAPGFFARRLLARDPLLPTCTEDDVQVPERRRHFLERAQTRARWRAFVTELPADDATRAKALETFLRRHELLLVCREQSPVDFDLCADDAGALRLVGTLLLERMHAEPTLAGHVAALARLHDGLNGATHDERAGLAILIDQLERGESDVEVPRQLARGMALRAGDDWSRAQHYLDPFPTVIPLSPR